MRAIAYPWVGAAVEETKRFLRSPIPKVASNMKYETRFALKKLGVWVNNWVWDTMLAAHTLDNRAGVTSIKFQAFVLLGEDAWDAYARPYFETKGGGGNAVNRIREADLGKVLWYNGMDSLMEWHVARRQREALGFV